MIEAKHAFIETLVSIKDQDQILEVESENLEIILRGENCICCLIFACRFHIACSPDSPLETCRKHSTQ